MIGSSIGNYRIEKLIGEGGMGKVYLAVHPSIGRQAAVKLLAPGDASDPQIVSRFLTEARASNAIRHPNIVDIYDCGLLSSGTPYIVMEYLEGETLAQLLAQGHVSIDAALDIACQVAEALAAAHAHEVVHRDLKPDNLFLIADPRKLDRRMVKVLDFGIAKLQKHTFGQVHKTRTGALMGTPLYMSPEQCMGAKEIDARTDIYSFGVILYEMFCGRKLFDSDSVFGVINMHINDKVAPPRTLRPEIPAELEAVILRALAKQPAQRHQSMAVLLSELELIRGNTVASNDALARFSRTQLKITPMPVNTSTLISHAPSVPELRTLGDTAVSKGGTAGNTQVSRGGRTVLYAVAVGVLLLGAGYFLATRFSPSPQATVAKSVTPPAAPAPVPPAIAPPIPAAPSFVEIALDSTPSEATVLVGGVVVGTTPATYRAKPNGDPVEFTFEHDGYATEKIQALPSAGLRLQAKLEALAAPKATAKAKKHPGPKSSTESDIKFER